MHRKLFLEGSLFCWLPSLTIWHLKREPARMVLHPLQGHLTLPNSSLKFIREKGFVKLNGILIEEISIKRWVELCKHPEVIVSPIIHEFMLICVGREMGQSLSGESWFNFIRR